jgi:hypothetical protein
MSTPLAVCSVESRLYSLGDVEEVDRTSNLLHSEALPQSIEELPVVRRAVGKADQR